MKKYDYNSPHDFIDRVAELADAGYDVGIYFDYDNTVEFIESLLTYGFNVGSLDITNPDIYKYDKEYLTVVTSNNEFSVEPAYDVEGKQYLEDDFVDVILISSDANSRILSKYQNRICCEICIDTPYVKEFTDEDTVDIDEEIIDAFLSTGEPVDLDLSDEDIEKDNDKKISAIIELAISNNLSYEEAKAIIEDR